MKFELKLIECKLKLDVIFSDINSIKMILSAVQVMKNFGRKYRKKKLYSSLVLNSNRKSKPRLLLNSLFGSAIVNLNDTVHPRPKKFNNSTTKAEALPGGSKDACIASNIYDVDTDVDSDHESSTTNNEFYENITLKILPNFFDKKTFYLGTDLVSPIVESLTRYIIAYKG